MSFASLFESFDEEIENFDDENYENLALFQLSRIVTAPIETSSLIG